MDFPLDIHGNALRAAQAGRCAGDQNLFWPMHDRMQSNPQQLELKNLLDYAHDIGLDVTLFRGCLDTEKYKAVILCYLKDGPHGASMGPRTLVRGNVHGCGRWSDTRYAPMGPRTLVRGNRPPSTVSSKVCWLQWGRALSCAEIRRSFPSTDPDTAGFNGAAHSRAR